MECPRCKSNRIKNNKRYYKVVDLEKLNLKTDTKVILLNLQKKCKECNKTFFEYKIREIDFEDKIYFKSLVSTLLERNLIKFEDLNKEEEKRLEEIGENSKDWFVMYRKSVKTNKIDSKNKVKIINIRTLETKYLIEKTEKVKKIKIM